jgi:[ribosomal protein S5]-alanine N-acetyltransferase
MRAGERVKAEPFITARLAMRAQAVDDAATLHEAYRDEELMRYWSSAPHATVEESAAYLMPRVDHEHWRGWSITLQGDDRAIGTLGASTRREGVSEIGYLLLRSAWGKGYAREAVTALIDLLFAEGNRRIFADTDPDNAASIGLLESLGFRREGLLRAEWETHIGVRDSVILGLLRDEWADRAR